MKLYLSSFKFGGRKEQLRRLAPSERIAVIPNALDFRDPADKRTTKSLENKLLRLRQLGFNPEVVNLRDYFGRSDDLGSLIETIGAVFILGGNVFVLRQAMKLSGLDEIIISQKDNPSFLYAGYSAAGCVLAPSLKPYAVVGDPSLIPYNQSDKVIWEGLGIVDFAFMPHWDSDHPETAAIERGIEYCKAHGIKYKAVRDGDVLILNAPS